MDEQQDAQDQLGPAPADNLGFDPRHFFATPDIRRDLSAVKPHACMENVRQIGNYVHCFNGNHGMRLAPGDILVRQSDGTFTVEPMKIVTTDKKGNVLQPKNASGKV